MYFRTLAAIVVVFSIPEPALAQGKAGKAGATQQACGVMPEGAGLHECHCPSDFPLGDVWGSGPYTGDSDICTAARHAGAIGADGGRVRVERVPSPPSYSGSEANGIATSSWDGSYDFGIRFAGNTGKAAAYRDIGACEGLPDGEVPVSCTCAAGGTGSVWGSGPYTGDSDICAAAVHAGAIGADGGRVILRRAPGADSYTGSEANGVISRDWGRYDESFEILPASVTGGPDGAVDLPACTVLPEGADRHDCSCPPDRPAGAVWGVGPYTADSDICTAARHAGVIDRSGGAVRVLRVLGLDFYEGGTGNGVSTNRWGESYAESIVFDRN